jgi:hypothetical protein
LMRPRPAAARIDRTVAARSAGTPA